MLAVLDADSPVSMCLHMYRHWYCSLTTTHSARNHGSIFDEHLTFSDQISAFSKSSYYRIRRLRCIRLYLDFKTVSTIATSIVHSKLDYCNSVITFQTVNLTGSKQIQNSLDRAVVKASKSTHITPILKSLHWLKVNERINEGINQVKDC